MDGEDTGAGEGKKEKDSGVLVAPKGVAEEGMAAAGTAGAGKEGSDGGAGEDGAAGEAACSDGEGAAGLGAEKRPVMETWPQSTGPSLGAGLEGPAATSGGPARRGSSWRR